MGALGGDPYWANVVFLFTGDDPVGTVVTDASAFAQAVTVHGDTTVATGGLFGKNVMNFTKTTNSLVSVANSDAGARIGPNEDFSVELWSKPSEQLVQGIINAGDPSGSGGFMIFTDSHGGGSEPGAHYALKLEGAAGTDGHSMRSYHFDYTLAWNFIHLRRESGVLRMYVNDIECEDSGIAFTGALDTRPWVLGAQAAYGYLDALSPGNLHLGMIGQVRITKGVARPVATPTEPFPTF